ncbi:MAG: GDSL-type esterase/lipase family protein [Candidatus Omnitrophota bacterium]
MSSHLDKIGITKKIFFSLIPLVTLLFLGEAVCRIKLYRASHDTYYLTSPFFAKGNDIAAKKEPVIYSLITEHFNEDPRYSKGKPLDGRSSNWYHGKDWYFKFTPGVYPSSSQYKYGKFTINCLGFRGNDFDPLNKHRKTRIFCVGESSTFGIESPDGQTWPDRLGYYLNKAKIGSFEVINSGIIGYSSMNYKNLMRYELINYLPDLFIIYAGFNDTKMYSHMQENKISSIFKAIHKILYYRTSMLYTLAIEKYSVLKDNSPIPMLFYDDNYLKEFKENILSIVDLCKKSNVPLIFVCQILDYPDKRLYNKNISLQEIREIIKKAPPRQVYEEKMTYPNYANIYKHNRLMSILAGMCQVYGIPYLDLSTEFMNVFDKNTKLFYDFVHFTPLGNDFLAKAIEEKLLEKNTK